MAGFDAGNALLELNKNIQEQKIPSQVLFELTYRCNSQCVHCYCVEEKGRRELDVSEIEKALKELADLGCFSAIFSGGETLLREDFFDILAIARNLHYVITVFTNGINVDSAAADKIAYFSPIGVEISLYGTTAETHEKITGVKGSFQKTYDAIRLLKERGLEVTVKWPLLRDTLPNHFALVEFAKSLGLECRADPLVFPRNDRSKIPLAQRLSDEELARAYEYLGTSVVKEEAPKLTAREKPVCGAGHDSCCISPYGDVYPCVQFFLTFGNIRENNFSDIWYHSRAAGEYRKLNNYADFRGCRSCDIVADCIRCPGLADLEDGNYLDKSRECCRYTQAMIKARRQLYKGGERI
jgi:AdoMet-dependent heme synthase